MCCLRNDVVMLSGGEAGGWWVGQMETDGWTRVSSVNREKTTSLIHQPWNTHSLAFPSDGVVQVFVWTSVCVCVCVCVVITFVRAVCQKQEVRRSQVDLEWWMIKECVSVCSLPARQRPAECWTCPSATGKDGFDLPECRSVCRPCRHSGNTIWHSSSANKSRERLWMNRDTTTLSMNHQSTCCTVHVNVKAAETRSETL